MLIIALCFSLLLLFIMGAVVVFGGELVVSANSLSSLACILHASLFVASCGIAQPYHNLICVLLPRNDRLLTVGIVSGDFDLM